MHMLRVVLAGAAALGGVWSAACLSAGEAKRPNVLFIAIDDMNDWPGCFGGHPQCRTPHIDALARRGVAFLNAHCPAPACNPSRTALMTGLRPSTSGVYTNSIDWRPLVDVPTLPMHFRAHGYYVAGAGKIYHGSFPRPSDWDDYLKKPGGDPPLPAGADDGVGGIKFAPLDCRDEDMSDWRIVSWVIDQLNKKHDRPFFLACGLVKPHMPWNVPRKYYQMYPLDKIVLPKVLETDLDDVPPAGRKMARPEGDHAAILQSGRWKEAVQAYLAATTFADAMVGRLIEALDRSGHAADTLVVLWGDNGWHLGEKLHWRKFALWEESTRVPLIWVVPGLTKPAGLCKRPVDFTCIYPTLAELCGLPIPKHAEGPSVRRLLENPEAPWVQPAIITHGFQNHAVRTEAWRYIRYSDGSEELYDELKDPHEWTNLAEKPDYQSQKAELAKWLPKVNRPTPPGSAPKRDAKPARKKQRTAKRKS
ncbi:MAG: sulfatase [Thermoguttaceae bacterium]